MSETCRVSFQNKNFEKLVHLVGSIIRNTIVSLCQKYHPEDGRITGRNMLLKVLEIKYIIKLKFICWFFNIFYNPN